jgi:Glycine rich protein
LTGDRAVWQDRRREASRIHRRRPTGSDRAKSLLTSAGAVLAGTLAFAPAAAAVTSVTFSNTGAQQQFVVPAAVTSVHVLAVGGRGGSGLPPGGGLGGAPAEVSGDVAVLPGETLYVEVGGSGVDASFTGIARAFDGGSFGGEGGAGGGGASDVRLISRPETDTPQSLFSRLIVAGGGGAGGAGSEGMLGGAGGAAGSAGESASTGVGGGGLFGGAGGSTNGTNAGAGGGGGSSLQPPGGNTVVPAVATAPEVQISYVPPPVQSATGIAPPPPPPSNIFALLHPVVGADGSITLVLDLEGPGTVKASATGSRTTTVKRHGRRTRRKVHFTYGTAAVTRQAGGVLELTIRPSPTGKKALKATKRLPLAIAVTFAPGGASPASKHVTVTVTRH